MTLRRDLLLRSALLASAGLFAAPARADTAWKVTASRDAKNITLTITPNANSTAAPQTSTCFPTTASSLSISPKP